MNEMAQRDSHWEQCVSSSRSYVEHLYARVCKGEINGSAVINLMRGYLDQPAYYPEWRDEDRQ